MIDGIEIMNLPLILSPEQIDNSPLDFKSIVSRKTGALSEKQIANYKGLWITKYSTGRTVLKGSITTFKHGNNCKNLKFKELNNTIDELCNVLEIDPKQTLLNGVEIGVNIKLKYSPDVFLNELLAWSKTKPLQWINKDENYLQFKRSQITLKIYSKSKQYNLSNHLLRYELRVDKMNYINKIGIRTLADLQDRNKLKEFSKMCINSFDELIYYDETINLKALKVTDKRFLERCNNPKYWINSTLHHNTVRKNKKKFISLVKEHGTNNFHNIKKLIEERFNLLLENSVQNYPLAAKDETQNSVHYYPPANNCEIQKSV